MAEFAPGHARKDDQGLAPQHSCKPMEPSEYEVPETLRDGTKIIIRAIRPSDGGPIREQFANLSAESVRFRFHGMRRAPGENETQLLTNLDFENQVALVATLSDQPDQPVGGARYVRSGEGSDRHRRPEVAFLVLDKYQGKGVGSLLLRHLAIIARAQGVNEFEAYVLADNQRMLRVFERGGFPTTARSSSSGVLRLTLSIAAEPKEN